MQPLQPADLHDTTRFALIQDLGHDEAVAALGQHLKRSSWIRNFYLALNLAALGGCGTLFAVRFAAATGGFWSAISQFLMGVSLGYFLLIPVHETVHAAAYRACGGKNTKVFYQWRQMTAFCVADDFVVDGRQLVIVCLAPFVVINALLLLLIAFSGAYQLFFCSMLAIHIAACSGDFGMVNLVWAHRGGGFWTYDDSRAKRTFFFRSAPAP